MMEKIVSYSSSMEKMNRRILPTFSEEQALWSKGITHIAGIDEVGRGAFAGPVVAASVVFPPNIVFKNTLLLSINDSKLLSAKKREALAEAIKDEASCFAIGEIGVDVINKIGIGKATKLAFQKSLDRLSHKAEFCLIDAFALETFDTLRQKAIVHGDQISVSIAAASIVAKVYRDQLMEKLHDSYKHYNFFQNKGYGTAFHREQIGKHGLSVMHRTSFALDRFLLKD